MLNLADECCRSYLSHLNRDVLVSVVVPSLNQVHYIEETISSILNQDYKNIELVVVDGGSTDGTLDILKKYDDDSRVVWISELDSGPNHAFNKGMGIARGELIGLQPSSDTYELHAISQVVKEFCDLPDVGLIGGLVREIDELGNPLDDPSGPYSERRFISIDDIVNLDLQPGIQSTFFRKDIALSIGGTDQDLQSNHTYFFFHYMLELIRIGGRSLCIPEHWGNFRRHGNSRSDLLSADTVKNAVERRMAYQRYTSVYSNLLTRDQTRLLLRNGYLSEWVFRFTEEKQIIAAVSPFWEWVRNGGLSSINVNRLWLNIFNLVRAKCRNS